MAPKAAESAIALEAVTAELGVFHAKALMEEALERDVEAYAGE